MSDFTDKDVAYALRRVSGQPCTPAGVSPELARYIQDRGYARFCEWPSGHWKILRWPEGDGA